MIGVLLITHGSVGAALLASATQIMNTDDALPQTASLGISRVDEPERVLGRARALLEQIDSGDGVLVITDIFGATPCNVAARLLRDGRVEGVSGASLPMVLRVLSGRNGSLPDAVRRARSGGADGVMHINSDRCREAQS